jgi:alpha-glucosidase
MMIYALRGTPLLYYGQELGLPDAEIPPERVVDVDGRDPERAPMPWRPPSRAGAGAGFTTGEPWLPVATDAECLCVEAQEKDAPGPDRLPTTKPPDLGMWPTGSRGSMG